MIASDGRFGVNFAIAFDGFVVTDSRPVFAKLEELFPGKGSALSEVWRTRLFEYTWLRTLAGHYVDFWQVTGESLVFAAKANGVDLSADQRDELMQTWLTLKAWPDVAPALKQLKAAGIRMAFLANLTETMLDAVVKNSGLEGLFEPHLSTDNVEAFKPDPRAYQMGPDAFKLPKEQIAFAAFAVGERMHRSGKDVLAAIVTGIDVACRLGTSQKKNPTLA